MTARDAIRSARLYGIIDLAYVDASRASAVTRKMVASGVDIVQLRAKGEAPERIESLARELFGIAAAANVPFIVNDHPEIAARIGCDGVHVGQDDATIARAREIVGPGRIVGQSTHSLDQAVAAERAGADYIGFGPLFATPTKPERPPIGLGDVRAVHQLVALPIFCIGGVKLANLDEVIRAGARRVVIVSELLLTANIETYVRDVMKKLTDQCSGCEK